MTDPSPHDPQPVTETPAPTDGVGDGATMNFLPLAEDEADGGTRVWSAETAPGVLPTAAPPSLQIPGYEVLEKLGEGGMGVVYKARQQRLNRVVALKMIRVGGYARTEELVRFLAEAEAVALLQHPNIVQVYDTGQHDGLPYFSLEFVGGGTLAEHLGGRPLAPAEAARVVEQLARAAGYAHSKGVVHRDLKPANVLLGKDEGGRMKDEKKTGAGSGSVSSFNPHPSSLHPKITDFGLAKRVESSSGVTQTGAIMGTPSYMAPEQASGDTAGVGPGADIYALGAILYDCLTGRPPFQAAAPLDVVFQVVHNEPVHPRALNPAVPRDLETICLRCLEKNPAKRYATADELADDLLRFLNREPILARPVGPVERAVKWARRRPTAAALVVVSVLAAATVATALTVSNIRVSALYRQTQEALANLEAEQERTRAALAGEQDALRKSRQAVAALADEETKTRSLLEKQERAAYRSGILLADRESDAPSTGRLAELLGGTPPHLRKWEWFVLDRQAHPARLTTPYPKAEVVAWTGGAGVETWTGTELVRRDAGGKELSRTTGAPGAVPVSPGTVAWLDAANKKLFVRRPDRAEPESVGLPDTGYSGLTAYRSGYLAANRGGHRLTVWELRDATRQIADLDLAPSAELRFGPKGLVRPAPVFGPGRVSVQWGPGGSLAVSAERNNQPETLSVYRLPAEKPVVTLHAADGYNLASAGWNPNGAHFGSFWNHWLAPEGGSPETYFRVWDTRTGAELQRFALGPVGRYSVGWDPTFSEAVILAAAPADDSRTPGVVWSAQQGTVLCRLAEPTPLTSRVVCIPSGGLLLTVGPKARVWATSTGKPVATLDGDDITLADRPVVSGTGRVLGTCRAEAGAPSDRLGRVWDAFTGRVLLTMKPRDAAFNRLEWSADGSSVITGEPGLVRVWDLPPSASISAPPTGATLGPDGQSWASRNRSAGYDPYRAGYGIAEVQTPAGRSFYTGHAGGPVGVVAWTGDGKRIASCSGDMTVKIWNPDTGAELRVYGGHPAPPSFVWWAAGDRRVLTHSATDSAGTRHELRFWDPETGADVARLEGQVPPEEVGRRIVVTRDGKLVVTAGLYKPGTGGDQSFVRVWNAETGELVREFPAAANRLAVSADGSRVAAFSPAAPDELAQLRVWSADGKQLWAQAPASADVAAIGMSPDGSRLAVADAENVHLFDAATGKPVLVTPHAFPRTSWVVFSPDGTKLAAANPGTTDQQFTGRADILAAADGAVVRSLTPVGDETRLALLHWSPDSKKIGGTVRSTKWPAERQTIVAVDVQTGERVGKVTDHHSGFIRVFRWSPDGKRAATACYDRTAKVWDLDAGTTVTFDGHAGDVPLLQAPARSGWTDYRPVGSQYSIEAFAWSPDGRLVASVVSSYSSARTVRVWESATGRTLAKIPGPQQVPQLEFGPDGRFLLVRTATGPAQVWSVVVGKKVSDLPPNVVATKWSDDGARLVSVSGQAGARAGQLVVLELATGKAGRAIPFTPESGAISVAGRDVAVHADGRLALATAAGIEVWNSTTGRQQFTVPGLRGPLAWGPDGRLAAVTTDEASPDTVVFTPDGGSVRRAAEIRGPAASLLWTPDGSRLIVGRVGRGPVVCDPATGDELLHLKGPAARLMWATDGRTLIGFDQSNSASSSWAASPGP